MAQIWDEDKAMERLSEIKDGDHLPAPVSPVQDELGPSWRVGEAVKAVKQVRPGVEGQEIRLGMLVRVPGPRVRPGVALVDWRDGGSSWVSTFDALVFRGTQWTTLGTALRGTE